uniref:Hemoglobin, beta adult 2 n=1 Tax=Oncorhynchus kisutch TaxID=8019 RepID=A0A8C7ML72_ONCKI
MADWTDAEKSTISAVWGQVDINEVGPLALGRVLIVYPWTQRYFGSFGDVSTAAAIMGNPKVAAHGKVVCGALDKAVKNMGNILATYKSLSETHANKLFVDPDNFRVLADVLTIVIAAKVVCGALDKAVKNMGNILATYKSLSETHANKLFVDPENFRVLADVLTIVIAAKFGAAFTPEIQATWQKFMKVVVAAMSSRYF